MKEDNQMRPSFLLWKIQIQAQWDTVYLSKDDSPVNLLRPSLLHDGPFRTPLERLYYG